MCCAQRLVSNEGITIQSSRFIDKEGRIEASALRMIEDAKLHLEGHRVVIFMRTQIILFAFYEYTKSLVV